MNKALKTGISVVMCIAFAAVCAYALAFYEPDVSDTDFYAEWMNCISDEARVQLAAEVDAFLTHLG